jgi:hypothetical protein
MKPRLGLFLFIAMSFLVVNAQADFLGAAETEKSVTLIGSSAPELKLQYSHDIRWPVWTGEGPLFSANNLRLRLSGSASPVSANASADVILTPIALFEFSAGASAGTGWTLPLMGGLYGLQKTDAAGPPGNEPGTEPEEDPFGGLYYKLKAGAAFQFDTGAVFPGKWTHVLVRTYQEINRRAYTGAGDDQLWDYEISGALVNGINYYANYFFGYRTPTLVNTVGVLLETDRFAIEAGGEAPPVFFTLGLTANLAITERLNIVLLPQFSTRRIDADMRTSSEEELFFKRFAFQLTWRL